jgi:hypothetical protein
MSSPFIAGLEASTASLTAREEPTFSIAVD